ncbi:MAG: hypothetical protein ACLTTS_08760 [Acutalibacteraceae bacterium]
MIFCIKEENVGKVLTVDEELEIIPIGTVNQFYLKKYFEKGGPEDNFAPLCTFSVMVSL